jgi:hypothetical protein
MEQKTYTFPKVGAGDSSTPLTVTKTLAPPTNDRLEASFKLLGAKSFADLFTPETVVQTLIARIDIVGKEKVTKALDICLVEGSSEIDVEHLDLRISDGVLQDFFEQRSKSLAERQNSL